MQLLKRRKAALGMLHEHPRYDDMLKGLTDLGVDGMSDVEDCETNYSWKIMDLEWRAPAVSKWLRCRDAHAQEAEEAVYSVGHRDGRGGTRVSRIAGGRLQPSSER